MGGLWLWGFSTGLLFEVHFLGVRLPKPSVSLFYILSFFF